MHWNRYEPQARWTTGWTKGCTTGWTTACTNGWTTGCTTGWAQGVCISIVNLLFAPIQRFARSSVVRSARKVATRSHMVKLMCMGRNAKADLSSMKVAQLRSLAKAECVKRPDMGWAACCPPDGSKEATMLHQLELPLKAAAKSWPCSKAAAVCSLAPKETHPVPAVKIEAQNMG